MKAIIFGITGQDGRYLHELLRRAGIEVSGVSREAPQFMTGNVADYAFVETLVKNLQPNFIFHLAANSTTRHETLFENQQTIVNGTLNILEAVHRHACYCKVFITGSGLQFANNNGPISESDPFEAKDSYSMSRIQSVYIARYFRNLGIKVYIGYLFNHDSPFRSERHVNQKIVLAARRIAGGVTETIELGDITVKKEFSFAGDIASAIWTFVNNGEIFETTIGSGIAYSIADWLQLCFDHYHLNWRNYVLSIPGFVPEYHTLVSNPAKILSLGWQPSTSISDLALMMLTYPSTTHEKK